MDHKKAISIFILLVSLAMFSHQASATNVCSANPGGVGWVNKSLNFSSSETGTNLTILSETRRVIEDNISEYTIILKTGPGEFDKLGIHRVTREDSTWNPSHSSHGIMMLHGDIGTFDTAFMLSTLATNFSTNVSTNHSPAMYLAEHDIDVWGISLPWTFVPDNHTNFSFMQTWDTAKYLNDIEIALKFARAGRTASGSPCGKLFFLGWSRGAQELWSYANYEAGISSGDRDVKAMIPLEFTYKYNSSQDPLLITNACTRHTNGNTSRSGGTYHSSTGQTVKGLPDAGLFVAATETFLAALPPPNYFYHFFAANFDIFGTPLSLKYTNFDFVKVFVQYMPSFQSNGEQVDGDAILCGLSNPYDGNLGSINIPILNVAAAGGFGRTAMYTPSLTASNDTTNLLIAFESPLAEDLDYGHADTVFANNAPNVWWANLTSWIQAR